MSQQPLGWHLVVHLNAADIPEISTILRPLSVPFVIDHMGRVKADGGLEQRPFRALLDLMKLDKCWVKVCGAERVSTAGPPIRLGVISSACWPRPSCCRG
jgi:2-pyrone-4,6-dicarboxylate lactonase